ncbi:MAG: glycosyltransferase [Oscillospiraceae bacterium]|nr:glycosyltransferase [Oscillospiraceae bacterium]
MKILEQMKIIENGGVQSFVFNTTSLITSNDISFYSDVPSTSPHYDAVINECGRMVYYPSCDFTKVKSRLKRIIGKRIAFFKFLKLNKFDIVHINASRTHDVSYAAAARLAGCKKVIIHIHNAVIENKLSARFIDSLSRMLVYCSGDIFLACSERAALYMYPKRIIEQNKYTIINNGIFSEKFVFNTSKRDYCRHMLNIDDKLVIGNVGRLSYLKNHRFLLRIFSEIKKKADNSVLIIVGGGELEDELIALANELDISESIIFIGEAADTSEYLCAMDAFVMPSLSEGLGIAAIEAQCCGLKTFCSDTVPKEAAVTDLCSFIPLSADAADWADRILSRCIGYERTDRTNDIQRAGYDIRSTANLLNQIYNS